MPALGLQTSQVSSSWLFLENIFTLNLDGESRVCANQNKSWWTNWTLLLIWQQFLAFFDWLKFKKPKLVFRIKDTCEKASNSMEIFYFSSKAARLHIAAKTETYKTGSTDNQVCDKCRSSQIWANVVGKNTHRIQITLRRITHLDSSGSVHPCMLESRSISMGY